MVVNFRPIRIPGRWREGFALDYHTVSSTYLGDDEFGHPQFDNKRSEVGELLYRVKYNSDRSAIHDLIETAASFLIKWNPGLEIIVPVPPSKTREFQPVHALGKALSERLKLPWDPECVRRSRKVPELKNVYDFDKRTRFLDGVHKVDKKKTSGKRILLFDDLYRSGATLNAVTSVLYDQGFAKEVFALTLTRTRSNL